MQEQVPGEPFKPVGRRVADDRFCRYPRSSMQVGEHVGPHEILSRIGDGGMDVVYKARDTRLERTVAIKKSAEAFSERFGRPAEAIAALNDQHICRSVA